MDGTDRAPAAEAGTRRSDEGMCERVAKEGIAIECKKLLPSKGSRSFLLRSGAHLLLVWPKLQDEKDYERLATISEAFI